MYAEVRAKENIFDITIFGSIEEKVPLKRYTADVIYLFSLSLIPFPDYNYVATLHPGIFKKDSTFTMKIRKAELVESYEGIAVILYI